MVHTLTDAAQLFIFVLSPQQNSLVGWSNNSEPVLGLKDYEVARDGNLFLRHAHPDDRYQLLNQLEDLFSRRAPIRQVYRWIRPDTGALRWLLCRADPATREEGLVYEGIISDITSEVQQAGGDIRLGNSLFRALGLWIAILDSEGRIIFAHIPSELALFNFGDPAFCFDNLSSGKIFSDCFSHLSAAAAPREVIATALSGQTPRASIKVRWNERTLLVEALSLVDTSTTGQVLLTVRDCTEIEHLAAAGSLRDQAEHLIQLSSGMLHHINNSLQIVLGYASTISANPSNPQLISEACAGITKTIGEAAELIAQAIAFKDSISSEAKPVDLNTAVMSALNRVQDILSLGTKIAVSLGNLPPIEARAPSLVNALEGLLRAVHERFGSTRVLTLHTSVAEFRPHSGEVAAACDLTITAKHPSSQGAGNAARRGSPHATSATPKEIAKLGAIWEGLGAAFQYKRGRFGAESICIRIPALAHPERSVAQESTLEPDILIIDDDLVILQSIANVLQDAGYRSVTASNRRAAIQNFKRYTSSLRVVILDAILPSAHGSAVLKQLKRINPDVLVVGFSGASTPDLESLRDAGAAAVLRKPIAPAKLVETVRLLLAEQDAA